MDILAQVLSPWVGEGTTSNPYRPQLSDDYPAITWQDITGTETAQLIPPVNVVILEIQTHEQTYQTIASDPAYTVISTKQIADPDGQ